ncbi:MAG: nuclear export factor [Acidimicrobiales bacterium]|nr:nuclear export factor [Acidimicrobiales bacterium]
MRSLKVLAVAAALVVATAAPAAAHVSVQPSDAAQGGYAKLAFRVPNEQDNAATVKLEVQLPTDQKFQSVSVKPLPGWTAAVTDTTVAWSGGRIEPGQFQEFEISVGPLPKVDELTFKAIQTYDNGDVVRWIEPTPADGSEPEHPAPVLHLTAATGSDHHDATAATVAPTTTAAPETVADTSAAAATKAGSDSGDGKVIGAYALGAVALAVAASALVLARRKSAGA